MRRLKNMRKRVNKIFNYLNVPVNAFAAKKTILSWHALMIKCAFSNKPKFRKFAYAELEKLSEKGWANSTKKFVDILRSKEVEESKRLILTIECPLFLYRVYSSLAEANEDIAELFFRVFLDKSILFAKDLDDSSDPKAISGVLSVLLRFYVFLPPSHLNTSNMLANNIKRIVSFDSSFEFVENLIKEYIRDFSERKNLGEFFDSDLQIPSIDLILECLEENKIKNRISLVFDLLELGQSLHDLEQFDYSDRIFFLLTSMGYYPKTIKA